MEDDPYSEMIDEQWDNITAMYELFEDKSPIIEFDVTNGKVFSYPADDYLETLSARTRTQAKQQYREATRNGQFMLFVKDSKNRKFRSYIFNVATD